MTIGQTITLEDLERDPYPIYERLRAEEPVSWVPAVQLWLVTRWDEVYFVDHYPELFTGAPADERSDQYSFVKAGVPAVALKFGFALGSPQQQIEKDWRTNRYHAPSDDLNQPLDKQAAGKFHDFTGRLLVRVADADAQPAWKPASFFKRSAGK